MVEQESPLCGDHLEQMLVKNIALTNFFLKFFYRDHHDLYTCKKKESKNTPDLLLKYEGFHNKYTYLRALFNAVRFVS